MQITTFYTFLTKFYISSVLVSGLTCFYSFTQALTHLSKVFFFDSTLRKELPRRFLSANIDKWTYHKRKAY